MAISISSLFNFSKAVETARGAPSVPRLVEWIEGSRIRHDRQPSLVDGREFVPGECYFNLRLAGLHLKDARRFSQQVLPLCICLAEFHSRGKRQTIPFSLGPDTIRQRLKEAQPKEPTPPSNGDKNTPRSGWVELHDIEVVRPMPVTRANLGCFIGLYAVPGDDVARTLLNVMGNISDAFGGALAPALGIAEKVYSGFTDLLGVKGVTPEVEAMHGNMLKNSGYLLVSNAPENSPVKGKLFVSGGRLRTGEDPSSPLVTEFDYCLLSVQRHDTVIEAGGVAPDLFDTQWQAVIDALEGTTEGAAEAAFKKLKRTIYGSELITRDRDAALAGYLLEYNTAARHFGKVEIADTSRGATTEGVLLTVNDIPELYGPLSETGKPVLTEKQTDDLKSGSSAWARAAELRKALARHPAGTVADTIMRAQA